MMNNNRKDPSTLASSVAQHIGSLNAPQNRIPSGIAKRIFKNRLAALIRQGKLASSAASSDRIIEQFYS